MDMFEQVEYMLNLPDEQFDKLYETLMVTMEDTYAREETQNNILNSLKSTPSINLEEEKEGLESIKNEILSDDSISQNKKNWVVKLIDLSMSAVEELTEVPRARVTVEIQKLNENAKIPLYAHSTDAGADVFSAEDITLAAGETKIIKTGLKVAIPIGYEIQVRPRSGLSAKTGIRVANAPGTIDSDYRGEVGIILHNTAAAPYEIKIGDKIAQLVISPVPMIKWKEVATISDNTDRSTGGFGSSGR